MLPVVSLLILAFAVSLDGFGVGVMYGLRKIRMPLFAIGIIALCSGTVIYCSMKLGQVLLRFVSPDIAKTIGAVILMGIGVWAIYQIVTQKDRDGEGTATAAIKALAATNESAAAEAPVATNEAAITKDAAATKKSTVTREPALPILPVAAEVRQREPKKMLHIEIKKLGLVIQILKTPAKADLDQSGNISAMEATLLGVALSLDSFGAGIGAALLGFAPFVTAIVIALASGSFVTAGLRVGFVYSDLRWLRKLSILPGCILILMGILKLL